MKGVFWEIYLRISTLVLVVFIAGSGMTSPVHAESLEISAASSNIMAKGLRECVNQRCVKKRLQEGGKDLKGQPDYKGPHNWSRKMASIFRRCKDVCSDKQIADIDTLAANFDAFSESKPVFGLFHRVGDAARERVRRPFTINVLRHSKNSN